jgi:hypothetical protein
MYQHIPLQDPPKFTQIGIFGLKIYNLATLHGETRIFQLCAFPDLEMPSRISAENISTPIYHTKAPSYILCQLTFPIICPENEQLHCDKTASFNGLNSFIFLFLRPMPLFLK